MVTDAWLHISNEDSNTIAHLDLSQQPAGDF
jgi:hypothetical protein